MKTKYARVFLGGNIRRSVLSFVGSLQPDDLVVLELSSFQLEDMAAEKRSPHIAVMTNILRDHLNWHGSMAAYVKAKSRIFAGQQPGDYLFINPEDQKLRTLARSARSRVVRQKLPRDMVSVVDERLGIHYRSSVGLAIAVARHYRVPLVSLRRVLRSFRGLPARQEIIARINGIHFVNDTTATVPDAGIACVRRFRGLAGNHRLILIAGGQDKKLNFREFAKMICACADMLILLPGTGTEALRPLLLKSKSRTQRLQETVHASSMNDAVAAATARASRGDWIILSPGAASFGLFANEFDRGDKFAEAVEKLKS